MERRNKRLMIALIIIVLILAVVGYYVSLKDVRFAPVGTSSQCYARYKECARVCLDNWYSHHEFFQYSLCRRNCNYYLGQTDCDWPTGRKLPESFSQ